MSTPSPPPSGLAPKTTTTTKSPTTSVPKIPPRPIIKGRSRTSSSPVTTPRPISPPPSSIGELPPPIPSASAPLVETEDDVSLELSAPSLPLKSAPSRMGSRSGTSSSSNILTARSVAGNLYRGGKELEKGNRLAEFYALIKGAEKLEESFIAGYVEDDVYTKLMQGLIARFKEVEAALKRDKSIQDVSSFMTKYHLDCPYAFQRLVTTKVPSTLMHALQNEFTGETHTAAAKAGMEFVSLADSVHMKSTIGELAPMLQGLLTSIRHAKTSFNTSKLEVWHADLSQMPAMDTLSPEDSADFFRDLESDRLAFLFPKSSKDA